MYKYLLNILILSVFFTTMSCETQEHIVVSVVDETTKEAIDSVLVEVKAGKNGSYDKNYDEGFTDENGKYETHMMIGCSFGCYDIQISYNKEGYHSVTQINNTRDTIELSPK